MEDTLGLRHKRLAIAHHQFNSFLQEYPRKNRRSNAPIGRVALDRFPLSTKLEYRCTNLLNKGAPSKGVSRRKQVNCHQWRE